MRKIKLFSTKIISIVKNIRLGFLKKIQLGWLLFGVFLFMLFTIIRFPVDKMIGKALQSAIAKTEYSVSFQDLTYSLPLDLKFSSLTLENPSGLRLVFFDTEISLDAGSIFGENIGGVISADDIRIISTDILIGSNLQMVFRVQGVNQGLSKVLADISLNLHNLAFSDLKKILKENPNTKMAYDLLENKLPSKLTFSSIEIVAGLENRKITITKGDIIGKEIIGDIKGQIEIKEEFIHSRPNITIQVTKQSPIWQTFSSEVSLLQAMKIVDEQGNLRLFLAGSFASPSIKFN